MNNASPKSTAESYATRYLGYVDNFLQTEPEPPEPVPAGAPGASPAAAAAKTALKRNVQYNRDNQRQTAPK